MGEPHRASLDNRQQTLHQDTLTDSWRHHGFHAQAPVCDHRDNTSSSASFAVDCATILPCDATEATTKCLQKPAQTTTCDLVEIEKCLPGDVSTALHTAGIHKSHSFR